MVTGNPSGGAGTPRVAPGGARTEDTLRPPRSNSAPSAKGVSRAWLWVVLASAVTVAVLVTVALPGVIQKLSVAELPPVKAAQMPPQPGAVRVQEVQQGGRLDDPVEIDRTGTSARGSGSDSARAAATAALQSFLRLRARPELAGGDVWGDPEWDEAQSRAAAAESFLREEQFARAAQAYDQAERLLQVLVSERTARLAKFLADADAALRRDDIEASTASFQRVLAMQSDHEQAGRGLERARARAEVLRHMEAGRRHETESSLDMALQSYSAALGLDAAYPPAAVAAERIRGEIDARQFRDAMSRGLAAIDAGDLKAASAALAAARRLRPDDTALRDASRRLAAASQHARLVTLRAQAATAVAAEDWQGAAERYDQALAVDANASFARHGRKRALERQHLHGSLDRYLDDPSRLGSAEPFDNAEQLLAAVGTAGLDEPRLGEKLAALRAQVDLYKNPIRVTLHSDGETDVAIYHVGRLGRFLEKRLELRPGRYTLTGTRPGYRDTRQVLELRPGATVSPVIVQCEEAI